MSLSKSMQDLIENDIDRLRSAIKSKHISVHKELYDSILQTYDTVIPGLTDGLEEIEQPVQESSPFRRKPVLRSTRLNGDLLRVNLGKLVSKLEIFLEDGGEPPEAFDFQPVVVDRTKKPAETLPAPPLPQEQEEIISSLEVAIQTVSKRSDLSRERREEFLHVLSEIKTAVAHEDNKKERWKLIRPLLSWAYNQTDPSIASDLLFLLSEAIR